MSRKKSRIRGTVRAQESAVEPKEHAGEMTTPEPAQLDAAAPEAHAPGAPHLNASDAPQGDAHQGDAPQADASQGDAPQADASQGDPEAGERAAAAAASRVEA